MSYRLSGVSKLAVSVLTLVALLAAPAAAQRAYKSLPVDERARALGTIARRYVKSPSGDAADKQKLNDYVFKYHLPKMTQTDAASLGDLGKMRYELLRNFLRAAEPSLATELTGNIFSGMRSIVPDREYHRAVRYSAILLIGQLDAQYGSDTGNPPPQPLPAATSFLSQVVTAGLTNPVVPAELIVGGLVGLERHAQFAASLPQQQQAELLKTLLAVTSRESLPQEVSRDVEQWINLRACSALAYLKSPGPNNQIHNALVARFGDEAADVDTRARIAGLMKRIDYSSATLNDTTTARELLSLATAIGTSEAKFAEDFEESQLNPLGYNTVGLDIDSLPSEYKRTRLLSRLTSLQAAATSLDKGLKQAEAKQALAAIASAITPVITEASDAKKVDLNVTAAVKICNDELKRIAANYGVKPEEDVVEANVEEDELDEAAEDTEDDDADAEPAAP